MVVYAICGFLTRHRQFQKLIFDSIALRARGKQSIVTCLLSVIIGVVHARADRLAKSCARSRIRLTVANFQLAIVLTTRPMAQSQSRKTVCLKCMPGTAWLGSCLTDATP